MNLQDIVRQLDQEIERLEQARKHLTAAEGEGLRAATNSRIRPRREPRQMSQKGRNRIAAAQRKRWAKVRAQKKKK